jgi:DNA modification methylase
MDANMQIDVWPIERIKEYDRNPRKNDAAVGPVVASIRKVGFLVPVLVDSDGVLICGHTRIKAARQAGLSEVPVIRVEHLTPEQVREFRIAENKLHEYSSWDEGLLLEELKDILKTKVEPEILGFSTDEITKMLDTVVKDGFADPDAIPEPPDEAVTKPGDLWLLGSHRLLCGDSADPKDVDRLLDGKTIQLCNTDPPYNVKVEPRSKIAIAAGNSSFTSYQRQSGAAHQNAEPSKKLRAKDRPLENDFVSDEEFERLLHAWFDNIARALDPGRGFYIWGGYSNCGNYPPVLKNHHLYLSQAIIWDKEHPVLSRKDYMGAHEWCFYGWREGAAHQFFGPNNATDLWHVKKINPNKMVHLTEKPVELAVRAIQYSSRPSENVMDLFGGSGSTLIAAEQTNRKAFLMEIDPLYCDVIVNRFETFTGQKAALAA